MTTKRWVLGIALGVALTLGLWATGPASGPARAQTVPFQCARVGTLPLPFPPIPFDAILNNVPLAAAVPLLAGGATCIPQAAADAAPRFNCTLQGRAFTDRSITAATAILRAGGQCAPAGLPSLPAP